MTRNRGSRKATPQARAPKPKEIAPPKITGGGGFVFEDKVVAHFLACMLVSTPPLEPELGTLVRIDFQTRPDGWYLDDVLLTLQFGEIRFQCALSVKSNAQFGAHTAPPDFVTTAWQQLLHFESHIFDETKDYLGLVTSRLPPELHSALHTMLGKARAEDPEVLGARYAEPDWAGEIEKQLFESYSCPQSLQDLPGVSSQHIGRLLRRLYCLERDFEEIPSTWEQRALELCCAALVSGDHKESLSLWESLLHIAFEYRPRAGYVTRQLLLDKLRDRYRLKEMPNHQPDWDQLDAITGRLMDQVSDTIGRQVHLNRAADLDHLTAALTTAPGVVLLGPSGVGKSAIVKQWAVARKQVPGETVLWFDAEMFERRDFLEFEGSLRLNHPLAQILANVSRARVTLVLDGLDRLNRDALRHVGTLLKLLDFGRSGGAWRIITTCQTQEWTELAEGLFSADVPTGDWLLVECTQLRLEDLNEVWEAFPRLSRLQYERKLRGVLRNLKILDLIASKVAAGGLIDTSAWVGESSIAEWFWKVVVAEGSERVKRARFVQVLAEKQASDLRSTLPLDALNGVDLDPATELIDERICRETDDGHIGFEHDLYGDWARQRLLAAHAADLSMYLKERAHSPLWHRAIRLHGTYLLEQPDGLTRWLEVFDAFGADAEGSVIQDLLLEAPVFAADPGSIFEQMYPILVATDGQLLRRLLGRFLHSATLPDSRIIDLVQAEGGNLAQASARFRVPYWPLWLPMLRFLHVHGQAVVPLVGSETSRIVRLWLDNAPTTWPLRTEAASLGLLLGEHGLVAADDRHQPAHKDRRNMYAAALAGGRELPDDVSDFALRASKRRGVVDDSLDMAAPVSRLLTMDPRYDPNERLPSPWPDGPFARVDNEFRQVVLEDHGLRALIPARPSVAREVALAVLIKERHRYEWYYSHQIIGKDLSISSEHFPFPTIYFDGPFLSLLKADFDEGLELIARLVNFATERWVQRIEEERAESAVEDPEQAAGLAFPGERERPATFPSQLGTRLKSGLDYLTRLVGITRGRWIKHPEQDQTEVIADGLVKPRRSGMLERLILESIRPPGQLTISLDGVERTFIGDERVHGWGAGLKNPGLPVEAALMALEQFFYELIEGGVPIDAQVGAVLKRARSVAFLKVLCDVGRRAPDLFEGPLRPLLGSQEVYRWDIATRVEGRTHLMIGAFRRGDWFVQMAQHFHTLDHRDQDLRDIALQLFFNRSTMRPFFEDACRSWESQKERERDPDIQAFLEQLIIRFDLKNWCVEELPNGCAAVVNVRHREMQAQHVDDNQRLADTRLVLTFPVRCRQLIDGEVNLSQDEVEPLWQDIQQLCAIKDRADIEESLLNHVSSGICGGIAVLVRCHQDWLDMHEDRRGWCQEWLLSTMLNPPPETLSTPRDVSNTIWDCFAAEAASALWIRDPNMEELRQQVAMLVFAYHHGAVQILFARCAEQRVVLGEDFTRLRRLLLERAYVDARSANLAFCNQYIKPLDSKITEQFRQIIQQWEEDRVAAFIAALLPAKIAPWQAVDDVEHFRAIDRHVPTWRHEEYPLDFELVQAAHSWLPTPDRASTDDERAEWLTFWHEALAHSLRRPARWSESRHEQDQRVPHVTERWVLYNVAAAIPYLHAQEAEEFWRTILDLSDEAHYWVEDFLSSFHRRALQADPVPEEYVPVFRAMFVYAASQRTQEGSLWSRRGDCWLPLLGLDSSISYVWAERHREPVDKLADLYELWAQHGLTYGLWAAAFALFLESPAADPIVTRGLLWLSTAASAQGSRTLDDKHARDGIASLLLKVWETYHDQLTSHQDYRIAFQNLLQLLVAQQQPLALELQTRIGGL